VKTHSTVIILLLCVQWQKKNPSATFFKSHSNDGVKCYITFDISDAHIHQMWDDVYTGSDGKNFFCMDGWMDVDDSVCVPVQLYARVADPVFR